MPKRGVPFRHPWDEGPLSNYARVFVGGTPNTAVAAYWSGNVPWMVSGDVHLRTIDDVPGRISDRGLASSAATIVEPEAVAVALAGQGKTRGTVALTRTTLSTNQSVALIKPKDGRLAVRFLYHSLVPRYEELRSRSLGGGRAGLTKSVLEALPIQVPSPAEQLELAAILDTVDEAIDRTSDLIAKKQQIKTGVMNDLFTRGIGPDGALRPTQENAPNLYKNSDVGFVPLDWTVGHLADCRRNDRAHLKTGPFGSSLKLEHWVAVGHPVITIGSLGEGEFVQSELLFVGPQTVRRMKEFQVTPGDVVFSRVADVGRSAVIRPEHTNWIMSGNLMRISLDPLRVIPAYLQAQLASDPRVRRQIRRNVNAGGRDVANSAMLNRLWFAWPTPEEQRLILDRIETLRESLQRERQVVEKLKAVKRGLMQDLLSGSVRVAAGRGETAASGV